MTEPMATFPECERSKARLPVAGDEDFLAQLYASTRADLLHLPVPAELAAAIIGHQRQLQAAGYAREFPNAQYFVLEEEEVRVGRLVIDCRAGVIRVVDLAIAPEARRRGHARSVLQGLQEQARRDGSALVLRVLRDNLGARSLYESLGFVEVSSDELALQMRWEGQSLAPA